MLSRCAFFATTSSNLTFRRTSLLFCTAASYFPSSHSSTNVFDNKNSDNAISYYYPSSHSHSSSSTNVFDNNKNKNNDENTETSTIASKTSMLNVSVDVSSSSTSVSVSATSKSFLVGQQIARQVISDNRQQNLLQLQKNSTRTPSSSSLLSSTSSTTTPQHNMNNKTALKTFSPPQKVDWKEVYLKNKEEWKVAYRNTKIAEFYAKKKLKEKLEEFSTSSHSNSDSKTATEKLLSTTTTNPIFSSSRRKRPSSSLPKPKISSSSSTTEKTEQQQQIQQIPTNKRYSSKKEIAKAVQLIESSSEFSCPDKNYDIRIMVIPPSLSSQKTTRKKAVLPENDDNNNFLFTSNDIILVPSILRRQDVKSNLSPPSQVFQNIIREVSTLNDEKDKKLIINWHNNKHFVVDNRVDWSRPQYKGSKFPPWLRSSPTCCNVLLRMCETLQINAKTDIASIRLNIFSGDSSYKPPHHDRRVRVGKRFNITCVASFSAKTDDSCSRSVLFHHVSKTDGLKNDLLEDHKKSPTTICLPASNGSLYCFGRGVNENFMHSVPPSSFSSLAKFQQQTEDKEEKSEQEQFFNSKEIAEHGRLSLVIFGFSNKLKE